MSVIEGFQIPVEVIGGLVTDFAPEDLPPGVSPDCSDVEFSPGVPGSVNTRQGTSSIYSFYPGTNVTYLATYTDPQGNNRNLYMNVPGAARIAPSLWQEYPQGTFTQVNLFPNSGYMSASYAKSDTGFGREFIGFSDGMFGQDIPRQWNGEFFDRVSSNGPGAAVTVANSVQELYFAITSIQRASAIISAVTATPHNLTVGSIVNIQGVQEDQTLNGQLPVASVPTATVFTAWAVPGVYGINSLVRSGGTVTASLTSAPVLAPAATIIIGGSADPSFDGEFTVVTVVGTQVTWAQAGANANSIGGSLYIQTVSFPIVANTADSTTTERVTFQLQNNQVVLFTVGGQANISGSSSAGVDGTYTVQAVYQPYPQQQPNVWAVQIISVAAAGYGGTLTMTIYDSGPFIDGYAGLASNISAGLHQFAVSFIMRSGYITRPSPPVSLICLGGFKITYGSAGVGVPIGPSPIVVGRIIMATVSGGANFFYSANNNLDITAMQINDNTTNTWLLDFSDLAIASSVSADTFFDKIVLPEVAGFIQYADRMIAWGALNVLQNWQNMDFDGGFYDNVPLGWASSGAGQLRSPGSPVWGDYFSIVGDGDTAVVGMITQTAYQDPYNVNRIEPNTAYSVRVLLNYTLGIGPVVGTVHIHLYSASLGIDTGLDVSAAAFGSISPGNFRPFTSSLTAGLSVVPADLLLRVYADGTPTDASVFGVENIEIFPTLEPNQNSVLFGSNPSDPETFQGTTGFVTVNVDDGRRITTCYVIRDRLFMLKNIGGLFTMTEDKSADFSDWDVDPISNTVGCESINGVGSHSSDDSGEDWVFITSRDGLYIHWSTEPVKVSQEIQPTWDQINWGAGYTIWSTTDITTRRVLIGVPTGSSTIPNVIYYMNYNLAGANAEDIANAPAVSPTFTGELKAHSRSRKWAIWNIVAAGVGAIERDDGTAHIFLGNQDNIVDLLDENLADVTGPINAYYTTSFYPSDEQKQQILQMKGSICHARYLTLNISGIGTLMVTLYGDAFVDSQTLPLGGPPVSLLSPAPDDIEMYADFQAERMAIKVESMDDDTPQFTLRNMQLYVGQDPTGSLRGFN